MCKQLKGHLTVVREYKGEIITFVGLVLMGIVYADYRDLARETAANNAETNAALHQISAHLSELKHWHAVESRKEKP